MGYAQTKPLSTFEFGNYRQTRTDISVSTVAADKSLGTLYLPAYIKNMVNYAYLDVYFPYCSNSAAAENYISGDQYIQVRHYDSGAWTNAIILKDQTYQFPAAEKIDVGRQTGYYDISTIINTEAGGSLAIKWASAKMNADSVIFKNIYCILRVAT
jgi:hypothetical protein